MRVNPQEEYGVRCMMQLALSTPDRPVTVAEIAGREGLSADHAGKLLYLLGRAGLANSVRGREGGFVLARPAYTISVAEILSVFSGDLFDEEFCKCYTGVKESCVHVRSCALRPVWWGISKLISRTLERITLMDLMLSEEEVMHRVRREIDAGPNRRALGDQLPGGPTPSS